MTLLEEAGLFSSIKLAFASKIVLVLGTEVLL